MELVRLDKIYTRHGGLGNDLCAVQLREANQVRPSGRYVTTVEALEAKGRDQSA